MRTIKTLFVILCLSTLSMACESDSIDDEVGIEINENDIRGEDDEGQTTPE